MPPLNVKDWGLETGTFGTGGAVGKWPDLDPGHHHRSVQPDGGIARGATGGADGGADGDEDGRVRRVMWVAPFHSLNPVLFVQRHRIVTGHVIEPEIFGQVMTLHIIMPDVDDFFQVTGSKGESCSMISSVSRSICKNKFWNGLLSQNE